MQPIFLTPVKKQTIWGGHSLAQEYGFGVPGEPIAEAWAVSAHPAGDCMVCGGEWDGMTLSALWKNHPELFACPGERQFPLLVKFIDAEKDLSIQVHPDDAYAAAHESPVDGSPCRGKSECWYILWAAPGARLVLGHNAATRQQAAEWAAAGEWKRLLRTVPVSAGQFYRIDPGTVHAIGGGIRLLEVQQSSDITYRMYDYDRLQNGRPRPLHLEQSLQVMTVPAAQISAQPQPEALPLVHGEGELTLLESCPYFQVRRLRLNGEARLPNAPTFQTVTVLEGEGTLNGVPVHRGQSLLAPHPQRTLHWQGELTVILAQPVLSAAATPEAGTPDQNV